MGAVQKATESSCSDPKVDMEIVDISAQSDTVPNHQAGELGFEPRLKRPERSVLPLHHSPFDEPVLALKINLGQREPTATTGRYRAEPLFWIESFVTP